MIAQEEVDRIAHQEHSVVLSCLNLLNVEFVVREFHCVMSIFASFN
jgi:hypothetical protein